MVIQKDDVAIKRKDKAVVKIKITFRNSFSLRKTLLVTTFIFINLIESLTLKNNIKKATASSKTYLAISIKLMVS